MVIFVNIEPLASNHTQPKNKEAENPLLYGSRSPTATESIAEASWLRFHYLKHGCHPAEKKTIRICSSRVHKKLTAGNFQWLGTSPGLDRFPFPEVPGSPRGPTGGCSRQLRQEWLRSLMNSQSAWKQDTRLKEERRRWYSLDSLPFLSSVGRQMCWIFIKTRR